MVYSYYFNDEITTESVNDLVEKLQAVEGKIELWFSTNGGDSCSMTFLISFLNRRKNDIKVILTNKCYSAGTDILVYFEGEIEIKELDAVLFHINDRESYAFRTDGYAVNQKILSKQDRALGLKFAEKIKQKGLLTDKQIKQFLKGKDVVVYNEQIKTWKNLYK